MTLNITVASPRCIYQCADYRLLDWTTGELTDFETQKIALVNNPGWTATVCFAGVGRTLRVDVGHWLAEVVDAVEPDDPFERLLERLQSADEWLAEVPSPWNRHSFSVGAFVGGRAHFALVSNFEAINARPLPQARGSLSVSLLRPAFASTFVSGNVRALSRHERRQLSKLVAKDPSPQRVYDAMASLNLVASGRSQVISPACFTTHVRLTGEGGGAVHGLGDRPFIPEFAFPAEGREAIEQLLDQQFGRGRAQLRQLALGRSESTEEYHQLQLREKPNDPNTHSNYGAFLKDQMDDHAGAERAYVRALALDQSHVNALGNLANLKWEQGETVAAETLYRRALEGRPHNENATFNFARFLTTARNDFTEASAVLCRGIVDNPASGRLHLLLGELTLQNGDASKALEVLRLARDKGADQARVEGALACALQMVGADVGECLAAYQVAVAVNPDNAPLKLNFAQLLFLRRDDQRAIEQLRDALRIGLDERAMLEAAFYQLAHTEADPISLLKDVADRVARGTRLSWNVRPNVERVREEQPQKADLLESVCEVMTGEEPPATLARVLRDWPATSGGAGR